MALFATTTVATLVSPTRVAAVPPAVGVAAAAFSFAPPPRPTTPSPRGPAGRGSSATHWRTSAAQPLLAIMAVDDDDDARFFGGGPDVARRGEGSGSRGMPRHRHGRRRRLGRRDHSGAFFVLGARKDGNNDGDGRGGDGDGSGSVLGASLLFAGTAIGAGMLALPAETAPAGFVPTAATLASCWAFTFVTSLITLEASWSVGRLRGVERGQVVGDEDGGGGGGAGFLSITKETLGPAGEGVTAVLFWFLLTSIVVAYTSEGGLLVSGAVAEMSSAGAPLPSPEVSPSMGSVAFMAFFASLAVFGTERVDTVNRVLVLGLVGSFLSLVGVTLPEIDVNLLSRGDWTAVYPAAVSVGILSFGAQNVVPTLLEYLGGDAKRTRRAVLLGSLIPLAMYGLWEAVFLGVVPFDASIGGVAGGGDKMQVVTALGDVGGSVVRELVEAFSACAIGSSMAGASVSLVDFFQDAIAVVSTSSSSYSSPVGPEVREPWTTIESNRTGNRRLLAAALALGPPLALAEAYPDAFLGALENAGLIGGVSLYGIIPALAVLRLRRRQGKSDSPPPSSSSSSSSPPSETMPGRLAGGAPALYGIVALSLALVVPEFVRLGADLLS